MRHTVALMVRCEGCRGKGKIPMPDWAYEALCLVRRHGETTAAGLVGVTVDTVGGTALNNRLEWLRARGFLVRRKVGKQWLYRTAP